MSVTDTGIGQFLIAFTFCGSVSIPSFEAMWPKYEILSPKEFTLTTS